MVCNTEKLVPVRAALRDGQAAGPVAFKDAIADVGDIPARQHTAEHDTVISAMPVRVVGNVEMRCYKGFWMMEALMRGAVAMERGFVARPDDVVLASLPKAGTTWLKALAFATMARGAWPPASPDHPLRRLNPHDCVPFMEGELFSSGREALLDALPSPRLLATHVPFPLLPSSIAGTDGCKIIYICRDEKDRAVSFWHFVKRLRPDISFSDVYESCYKGICEYGPSWDHILEYRKASNTEQSNVLFLTYENVLQHPCDAVRQMAEFLGKPFSSAEEDASVVTEIVNLCSFDNLRNQKANKEGSQGIVHKFCNDLYFRKGAKGDWVNHMTSEMGERLDAIFREKFDGSELTI